MTDAFKISLKLCTHNISNLIKADLFYMKQVASEEADMLRSHDQSKSKTAVILAKATNKKFRATINFNWKNCPLR